MIAPLRRRPTLLACSLALVLAPSAMGQTWTSFATSNWNNAANWSPGLPVSGNTTDLLFPGLLDIAYTATNDLGNPFVLRTMTFNNQSGGALTIAGTQIQLNGANAGFVNNGPGTLTISAPIDL